MGTCFELLSEVRIEVTVTPEQRARLLKLADIARAYTKGSMDPLFDWIADAVARAHGERTYIPDEPTDALIAQLEEAIRARSRG